MKYIITFFMIIVSSGFCFANSIYVSKSEFTLFVLNDTNDTIFIAPIAVGKNAGQKMKEGDCKTPEGTFLINQIQDSHKWKHDFGDGKGNIKGAYGPYFIRLETPGFHGIGIHGTHDAKSIGTRCTEGCIRLRNNDLLMLVELISVGEQVTIVP